MRRFERMERLRNLLIAVIGCIGWGLLGYLVMTDIDGLFWPGRLYKVVEQISTGRDEDA